MRFKSQSISPLMKREASFITDPQSYLDVINLCEVFKQKLIKTPKMTYKKTIGDKKLKLQETRKKNCSINHIDEYT